MYLYNTQDSTVQQKHKVSYIFGVKFSTNFFLKHNKM
jgi:hypothetical protein